MSDQPTGSPPAQTILLVDDDSSIRAVFSSALEHHGFRVLKAKHGAEALAMCQVHRNEIHLLLTDIMLPGGIRLANAKPTGPQVHGIDLMQKASRLCPGIRVLLFSGQPDSVINSLGVIPRGTAFLRKPFSLDTLVRTVRQALENPKPNTRS
jgi:CheY-like chemotaxis protein